MPKLGAVLVFAFTFAACVALSVPNACADELADYEQAKSRFDQGKWDDAAARFAPLLDPQNPHGLKDERLRFEASQMYAAALIALERIDDGKRIIAGLLRSDPTYSPIPGLYPQPYVDRVIEVRAELRDELERIMRAKVEAQRERERREREALEREKRRVAALEELAMRDTIIEPRSRWIAAIPFGTGQFQNDAIGWGVFFALSEGFTLTSTVVAGELALHYAHAVSQHQCNGIELDGCAPGGQGELDLARLKQNYETASVVHWVSLGSTAVLALAGIIEAEVALEDEVVTHRDHELPPELRPQPALSISPDGATFGLRGAF